MKGTVAATVKSVHWSFLKLKVKLGDTSKHFLNFVDWLFAE